MIAECVEELISLGHLRGEAVCYTPREMAEFLELARARKNREYLMQLHIAVLAARASQKDIEDAARTFQRNGNS